MGSVGAQTRLGQDNPEIVCLSLKMILVDQKLLYLLVFIASEFKSQEQESWPSEDDDFPSPRVLTLMHFTQRMLLLLTKKKGHYLYKTQSVCLIKDV